MILFTRHALERMRQRAISKEEVQQVIRDSDTTLSDGYGHLIAQAKQNEHMLRVFFRKEENSYIVITAYKTSKSDKYAID
ncbi:MAG: DUF4258 domain-containing protein [Candidatus Thorarchaeota archaeon]|nr:DUF4258 domain-containing protein [Candidatus Thorarchaeota archaeon]